LRKLEDFSERMLRERQSLEIKRLYEFGCFRLDAAEGVLYASSEPVKLTPKALQTLTLLVEKSGRIVTKDEFLATVWADTFVEENALSFNISQLRKILAKYDAETKFIETVPRRGFRFAAPVQQLAEGDESLEIVDEKHIVETVFDEETVEENPPIVQIEAKPVLFPSPFQTKSYYLPFTAIVLLLIFGTGSYFYFRSPAQTATTPIKNIAVLPFNNLNDGEQYRTLSLGLTDSLISRLGSLNRFAVRPLSAVQQYSVKDKDPLKFGAELKADAVLEGTLQMADNRLRVNLRLLSVKDGAQIWTGSFDEVETDVFKLQDAIAGQIAQSLVTNLSQQERQQLAARPTENNEAYELYLRGRYHWNQRTAEGFARSLELFQQAVMLDPRFAEAHVGIGDAHIGFYDYGLKPASETVPPARQAINLALQLNPNLSEAHSSLGLIQLNHDWNWSAAEKSFQKAIELNSNSLLARMRYGWFLKVTEKFDQARREYETALQFDPTSAVIRTNLGYLHYCARRYDEAEQDLQKAIALNPSFSLPRWYLGATYYQRGKKAEMFAEYLKALELEGDGELAKRLQTAWQKEGEVAALRLWRGEFEKRYEKSYFPPYNIALIAALQMDKEAKRQRDPWLVQALHDPEFDFVRASFKIAPSKIQN
jgi:DNA-binding winged helix-turn-helix (wHTH) protein/TolB-like protein/tetratricopeptide (TPR) repeat protein